MKTFEEQIRYEKTQMPLADTYYRAHWKASTIIRPSFATMNGKELQYKGIDAIVETPSKTYYVQEKFRRKDYGDFLFEIRDNGKPGWALTEECDGICYFTTDYCYEINARDLKDFAAEVYIAVRDSFDELVEYTTRVFYVRGARVMIKLQKNVSKKGTWMSVNAIVSWSDLNKAEVRFIQRYR